MSVFVSNYSPPLYQLSYRGRYDKCLRNVFFMLMSPVESVQIISEKKCYNQYLYQTNDESKKVANEEVPNCQKWDNLGYRQCFGPIKLDNMITERHNIP
jgi:hypothetical protein